MAVPAHGTVPRYRLELKSGTVCDRCRAANTRASRMQRARRRQGGGGGNLRAVEDAVVHAPANADAPPAPGVMEKAVVEDLAELEESERVAFHRSLSALALQLAREVDVATAATARSAASKQLFDVLKSLRSGRGADASTALDIVLEDFGLPLVSDGSA